MLDMISIDSVDKELLYEIVEWIELYGSKDDPMLHECAKRVGEYLTHENLEIPKRYVANIRYAFPAFCDAHPDKKVTAMALRRELTDMLKE